MILTYIVTSNCRVNGRHTEAGTRMQFDDNKPADRELFASMVANNRLADDTPEMARLVKQNNPQLSEPVGKK